jgi:hypothetical protein
MTRSFLGSYQWVQPGDGNGQLTSVVGTFTDKPFELVTLDMG